MKKLVLAFVLFASSLIFAWGGEFAISCGNNSWAEPNGITSLNAAWKFSGTGENPGQNSPNKYLILQGKSSPSSPGEITAGTFYFRIITLEGSAWYSWGGNLASDQDEPINLNAESNITCPSGNYQGSKAAYFSATDGKYYALLFPANPNGANTTTSIRVLEFDGQPVTLSGQSHNINGANLDLTLNLSSATVPSDQKFYVRYVWDGSTDWSSATITAMTVSSNTATVSIPIGSHSSITYYYFTTEDNIIPSNTNVDNFTLYYLNNSGSNYSVGSLPVELSNFNGKFQNNSILLTWKTLTEIDNKGFEVERLVNNNWTSLGFVNGKNNSNVVNNYEFTVNNFVVGKNVFRLKQVDNNGNFKYYDPIEIEVAAPKKLELFGNYPNPFNPSTIIKFAVPEKANINLSVYNITGQLVKVFENSEYEAGVYTKNIDLSGFTSGVYFVKLSNGKNTQVMKINLMK